MARPIYVPQAGGFIEFSDDATDAEIVSYLKAKFPAPPPVAAAPPPAAAGPDDSGIASRLAYGLATGLTDIPGGIAALMDPAKEAGETVGGRFSEGARQYLQETLGIDPTKEATTAQTLAQGVGSLGSFLIPGIGAAKGAGLLGAGARLAGSAAVATGAAQGVAVGAEQRAQRIRDQLESGMAISDEEQLAAQRLSGLIGASEALPLGRFFKPLNILLSKIPASKAPIVEQIVKNRLSRIASAGIAEGAQEAASGIANDLMEYGVYNPNVEIGQDLLSNAGTGAFAGSFLEGVIQLAAGRKLRASRQLAEDLEREAIANQAIVDQGELVRTAEQLRQYNVEGPVSIEEADIEGMTGFTIKAPSGNMFGAFSTPEQAQQAIDIYKQRTGAKISVREPVKAPSAFPVKIGTKKYKNIDEILADREKLLAERDAAEQILTNPDLLKQEAEKQKVSEVFYKGVLQKNFKSRSEALNKIEDFISAADGRNAEETEVIDQPQEFTEEDFAPVQGREAIPEEMPIGAIEMPIEEQRYIEPAAPIETPIEAEPPKKELRPSATDEQLTDLKAELFGTPKNIRDMTPEERTLYESERDKRYPPVEVDVSYDAGMLKTPKTLTEVEQRSDARKYTPEYQAFMDGVYTELSSRLSNIAPESVSLRLRDFVAGSEGRLTRGTETPTRTPDGLKSIIELATGYVRPGVTVEEMVNELVGTLNHEVIHALRTQGLLRPAEWQMLSRAAAKTKVPGKKYTYLDKAQAIYEPMGGIYTTEDAVIEEAVAEMYKDWVAGKNRKEAVPVAGLFNRITEFLRRIFRTLQNRKYEDVFKQISAGEMRTREGTPESRREGQRFSAAPVRPAAIQTEGGLEVAAIPKGAGSSSVYLRRDFAPIKGKVNIVELGKAFDRAFLKRFGRQYDISNPQDYKKIVDAVVDEVNHQMGQAQSGVGWYDNDIQDVFDELSKSFPILKDARKGAAYRQMFTVISGIMSNGMKAKQNVEFGAINFAHFLNTGRFSPDNPFTKTGWNQRSNIMGPQIEMLNSMIMDPRFAPRPGSNDPTLERLEKFLEFMFSEHSVREINKFRAAHGTKSPAKIGGVDDKRLGMYAFGPKFGPFILNLNGLTDETVDSWASRSFYRHMGRSINANGEMNDAPTGPAHREAMKRALRDVADRTKLSSRDVQAVLWFYEKELYNQLGQKVPLEVFSDGAREFTRKYGTGSSRPPQSRTDREREIARSVEVAGTREGAGGAGAEGVRFSAAPALNSEEFKRWFKNSKVVNPDGTPKVQYHGTVARQRFAVFDTEKSELGSHFGTQKQAAKFVTIDEDEGEYRSGGRVYPVYLSIQNPLRLVDMGNWDNNKVADQLYPEGIIDKSLYERAMRSNEGKYLYFDLTEDDKIRKELQTAIRKAGYDGIVYLNRFEGLSVDPENYINVDMGDDRELNKITDKEFKDYIPEAEDSYIVFRPEQVKSVFNKFEAGEARRTRFAAAPLPRNIAQANTTLFAPEPKEGFFQSMVQYFTGPGQQPKTLNTVYGQVDISKWKMQRVGARASAVDKNAFIAELEKLANLKSTGNYERMLADYSATAALGWRRRSSHINASMLQRGKLTLDYARPGDIQSATMKVVDDPDSMANIIKILMEPGPVDPVTNEQKDKREVFKSYAVAMRAKNKALLGIKTPNEVDQNYVNTVIPFTQQNYPEVVQAYEMYQRFNRNLLKTAKEAGLITDTELQNLTRNMDYYGFYREVFENVGAPGMPTKTASKFELRAMKGGEHGNLVGDPVYVMVHNAQFWVDSIAKNIAAQKSFKLAKDMGVARILGSTEKPDQARGEEEQVMFFRENGVQKRFAVSDPLLVMALGTDDRVDIGRFWQLAGMPTTVLRESVTRDPGFMVANLMRDTLSAWITSGEDITPFIGTVKGFAKAYKKDASFQALMGRGVVGSYDLAMKAPKELAADLRNRAMPKNVLTLNGPEAATAVIGGLWNRLGALSEYSDAATRIAVYEAARAQGLSEAEATFRAIEILDFSRRGGSQALSILTKVVPFLNARIQGMDVLYQAGKAAKKVVLGQAQGEREANLGKKFLVRGAMLAAISVALEMMNDDDEDYQQLDDYIKTGNLLIPLKYFGLEGQFLAIPKPFEAGLLFSTFPQEFYKSVSGDASTRSMVNLFISSVGSTFGVNPIPQALLPGLEILTNHDFYTGLPLISEGKARLSPELQYNSGTSQLAMMLGEIPIWYDMTSGRFEGLSPIVIDNLIGGYAGPWGTYLAQAVGMAMEGAEVGPERLPRDITQLPVVRRFFMDAQVKNPKVVTQAYELFRLVDEANRSFSRLRQTGDAEAVMDYLEENKDVLSYKKYVFKLVDRLNKLSAHERQIERDQTMTREEKIEAMAKLREVRIRLASKVKEINAVLGR